MAFTYVQLDQPKDGVIIDIRFMFDVVIEHLTFLHFWAILMHTRICNTFEFPT